MKKSCVWASQAILCAVLTTALSIPTYAGKADTEKVGKSFAQDTKAVSVVKYYKMFGINIKDKKVTAEDISAFMELGRQKTNEALVEIEELKKSNDKEDLKRAEELNDYIERMNPHLIALENADQSDLVQAFNEAISTDYALSAELVGRQKGNLLGNLIGYLGIFKNFFMLKNIPKDIDSPLNETVKGKSKPKKGQKKASKEAINLVVPQNDLAQLSPLEIGKTDIQKGNNWYYTQDELKFISNTWDENETKYSPITETNTNNSRRILKFSKIKTTATSAKVDTKDVDGIKWKLKWGEEVQTEPIANALALATGSKFQDLVYANKGGLNDLILILNKEFKSDCSSVATLEQLKTCLLNSKYRFDLTPYILKSGIVKDYSGVQSQLNSSLKDKKDEFAKDLDNRVFILFSESMVEYKGPRANIDVLVDAELDASNVTSANDIKEIVGDGPASLNFFGATTDRATRGMALFYHWIREKDAKDDNNRLVMDSATGELIAYKHDGGASLGGMMLSGHINALKTDGFIKDLFGKMMLSALVIYKPRAYKAATWSDLYWMAERITNIPRSEYAKIMKRTKWPDFAQIAMANRLITRRNVIAQHFGFEEIELIDSEDLQAVGTKTNLISYGSVRRVDLSDMQARMAAVDSYGLDIAFDGDRALAERAIRDTIAKKLGSYKKVDGYVDTVLTSNGQGVLRTQIPGCDQSVMVSLLEMTMHPSGLSRRVTRQKDQKPLSDKKCLIKRDEITKIKGAAL